jgi:hypothetical protein
MPRTSRPQGAGSMPTTNTKTAKESRSLRVQHRLETEPLDSFNGVIEEKSQQGITPLLPPFKIATPAQLLPAGLDDVVSLIFQQYVPDQEISLMSPGSDISQSRICGCWIEVLPALVAGREKNEVVLSAATRTLCISILNKDSAQRGLSLDFTEAYCSALSLLRRGLPASQGSLYAEFVAASMCLTLAEVCS